MFVQKVLRLKLLWIREFLVIVQDGVQGRNYNRALEGTKAVSASKPARTSYALPASCLEFYLLQDSTVPAGRAFAPGLARKQSEVRLPRPGEL